MGHRALNHVAIPDVGDLIFDGELSLRDIAAGCEYLFSSRSWIDAGGQYIV